MCGFLQKRKKEKVNSIFSPAQSKFSCFWLMNILFNYEHKKDLFQGSVLNYFLGWCKIASIFISWGLNWNGGTESGQASLALWSDPEFIAVLLYTNAVLLYSSLHYFNEHLDNYIPYFKINRELRMSGWRLG